MTASADERDSLLPLVSEADIAVALRPAWQTDSRRWGRVRNLTRAVAVSRPTWQAAVRAEQMFATMIRVDRATQALLCLYVSLLNGCEYCIDDAAGAALAEGVSAERMLAVDASTVHMHGERTAAALRFAYWVTMRPTEIPATVTDELRRYVDDEELLEITTVIAMKCFWNRFASTLRIPAEGRCSDPELLQALGQLSAQLRRGDRA